MVDFKLEFGRLADGSIILADEISPDTSRLWDAKGQHMDKDVFRRNIGDLIETYTEVLNLLKRQNKNVLVFRAGLTSYIERI